MKVIIYTNPGCVYCQMAKEFFKEHNVAYEERDVSSDDKARDEMVEKSGQLGVPVIDVDGKIVIGFEKNMISELLNIK
jgi:glutaredoxin-like YruB-family protein